MSVLRSSPYASFYADEDAFFDTVWLENFLCVGAGPGCATLLNFVCVQCIYVIRGTTSAPLRSSPFELVTFSSFVHSL